MWWEFLQTKKIKCKSIEDAWLFRVSHRKVSQSGRKREEGEERTEGKKGEEEQKNRKGGKKNRTAEGR